MAVLTGTLADSPAAIMGRLLEAESLVVSSSQFNPAGGSTGTSSDWPIYVANIPDRPDNLVAIFNTAGVKQGRVMFLGAVLKRFGIQLQIRSSDHKIGWQKANQLESAMNEDIRNSVVTLGVNSYLVHAFSVSSGPLDLGKTVQDSKRYLFSVNGTVSIDQTN